MPFYHRPPADRGPLRPRSPMALGQAAATPTPAELAEAAGVGYAVVDLETTGLSPTTDSILEVALVLTDAAGRVERSWSTLIDPGAGVDVGPTHIHGLVAEELIGAPGFDEVADLLAADLAGRAVVAHNA
uniref:exonuclease domain-containing protein n=1 Tax=uncultured Actinomyces sp. TaxID=249061 RepID=UPI0028051EB1